ncbi:MAG: hypothetical protein KAJ01_10315 [Candidatus Hydrogenedentes bacterium]|nr:hypothetical protein [Candidatus Hydrogenedentota bacterium]
MPKIDSLIETVPSHALKKLPDSSIAARSWFPATELGRTRTQAESRSVRRVESRASAGSVL